MISSAATRLSVNPSPGAGGSSVRATQGEAVDFSLALRGSEAPGALSSVVESIPKVDEGASETAGSAQMSSECEAVGTLTTGSAALNPQSAASTFLNMLVLISVAPSPASSVSDVALTASSDQSVSNGPVRASPGAAPGAGGEPSAGRQQISKLHVGPLSDRGMPLQMAAISHETHLRTHKATLPISEETKSDSAMAGPAVRTERSPPVGSVSSERQPAPRKLVLEQTMPSMVEGGAEVSTVPGILHSTINVQSADRATTAIRVEVFEPATAAAPAPQPRLTEDVRGGVLKVLKLALLSADLGSIDVRLGSTAKGLDVQFDVMREQTARILRDARDALSDALQSAGYRADTITVRTADGKVGEHAAAPMTAHRQGGSDIFDGTGIAGGQSEHRGQTGDGHRGFFSERGTQKPKPGARDGDVDQLKPASKGIYL